MYGGGGAGGGGAHQNHHYQQQPQASHYGGGGGASSYAPQQPQQAAWSSQGQYGVGGQPQQQSMYGGGGGLGDVGGGGYGDGGQGQSSQNWNAWAPSGVNEQVLNMGGNMAKNFLSTNMARYQPGVHTMWHTYKYYFSVNNRYVLQKLKILLLPFLKKDWHRVPAADGGDDGARPKYARPVVDESAPDLYLPLMSFVTYVLVMGFVKGRVDSFTPETLTEFTSTAIVTYTLEVLLVRLGLYLLGAPAVMLDLFAYSGYKFVALCINMILGITMGITGYYLSLLWTGSMMGYFMLKTLANTVPVGPPMREIVIFGIAGLQLVITWWLGDSKDLEG